MDLQTKQILIADQRKLALRHSWQSDFEDLISLIHDTIKSPSDINSNPTNNATIFRSNFWHILTSSWGFIIIGTIIIFHLIITRGISVFDKIFVILLIGLILVFFILGISYLFATIPIIKSPIVNYFINTMLNALVMYCIYFFGQKIERSNISSKLKF